MTARQLAYFCTLKQDPRNTVAECNKHLAHVKKRTAKVWTDNVLRQAQAPLQSQPTCVAMMPFFNFHLSTTETTVRSWNGPSQTHGKPNVTKSAEVLIDLALLTALKCIWCTDRLHTLIAATLKWCTCSRSHTSVSLEQDAA